MNGAHIIAGRRTAVAVRNGAFAEIETADLGAAVIRQALKDTELPMDRVDEVILGNALYGGGNPARVAALAAGLPECAGAMTIDTQCCGGLDAIALAAARVRSGSADIVIAGGLESYSRAPIRQRRPTLPGEELESYDRPPFTPWAERDPDMITSAADLAVRLQIARTRQDAYAVESHRRAEEDIAVESQVVVLNGLARDEFTRPLSPAVCRRLKPLSGDEEYGVTAATTAVEADAAAVVIVVSERVRESVTGNSVLIRGDVSRGDDPTCPALAPIAAVRELLARLRLSPRDIARTEMMEAFAVQALACIDGIGLAPDSVNQRGGALAWGHPIGASGAILAVRLFHDLQGRAPGDLGLAAIAAAGGLGSAMVLEAVGA